MAIESIERLTVQLGRLPGIGRKTAARLAYHILGVPPEQAEELAFHHNSILKIILVVCRCVVRKRTHKLVTHNQHFLVE